MANNFAESNFAQFVNRNVNLEMNTGWKIVFNKFEVCSLARTR